MVRGLSLLCWLAAQPDGHAFANGARAGHHRTSRLIDDRLLAINVIAQASQEHFVDISVSRFGVDEITGLLLVCE